MDLSIIIPTYNEEARIEETLIKFNHYLAHTVYSYEIIIADDGSTDGTVDLIEEIVQVMPVIKLVTLEKNKGKGQAVKAGMLAAIGNIRLFSDADGATPIHHLEEVINPIIKNEAPVSIGSRYLAQSEIQKSQPFYRRVWSRLANKIVQRVLLPGIVDPNCGFKAFDGQTAQLLFSQCTVNQWSFDLEILALAKKLDLAIAEVPVTWIHDERSKGKISQLPREMINLYQIKKRLKHT